MFLAIRTVAIVTYFDAKIITTCSSMIGQFFGYNDGNIKCKRVVIMTHQNVSVGNCFEHLCENRRSYILVFVLTKHVSLTFTLRPCLTRTLKRDVSSGGRIYSIPPYIILL